MQKRQRLSRAPPLVNFGRGAIGLGTVGENNEMRAAGHLGTGVSKLALLRRPAISLRAGLTHQRSALTLVEVAGLKEAVDDLFVTDDCESACPVRTPQATVETPGIE